MNSTAAKLRNTWKAALGSGIETLAEERATQSTLPHVTEFFRWLGRFSAQKLEFAPSGAFQVGKLLSNCMPFYGLAMVGTPQLKKYMLLRAILLPIPKFLSKHHSKNTVGWTAANLRSHTPVSSKQWHRHTRRQRKVSLYLGGCVVDYSLPRGGGCWLLHCEDLLS